MNLPDDEWDTVGGLVFYTLGHVPDEGECVTVDGLEFCAERVQGRRIVSVLDQRVPGRATYAESITPLVTRRRSGCAARQGFRSGFVAVVGPAQRRQVDAREPHRRPQGRDRLRQAADDPQRDPRRAHDRHDTRSCSSTRPACTGPRTLLGERSNQRALATLAGVDVVCVVVEAIAADRAGRPVRRERRARVGLAGRARRQQGRRREGATTSPRSSRVRRSSASSRRSCRSRRRPAKASTRWSASSSAGCPRARSYYPEGVVTDQPEAFLAAELLREQLLKIARDELPHSIMVVVDEIEERETASGPLLAFHARVLVERDSQRGIVIGRAARCSRPRARPPAESSRRCSAPACTSRRGCGSSPGGSAAPSRSTGSDSDVNQMRIRRHKLLPRRGGPDRVPRRAGPGTVRASRGGESGRMTGHTRQPRRARHGAPSRCSRGRGLAARRRVRHRRTTRTRCTPTGPPRTRSSNLFTPFFFIAVVIGIGVLAATVILPLKFRAERGQREPEADPRQHDARDHVDDHPRADPGGDGHLHGADDLQARQGPEGSRRHPRRRQRQAVVVGVQLPEGRHLHRQRAAHPDRPAGRAHASPPTTSSTTSGCRSSRARRTSCPARRTPR